MKFFGITVDCGKDKGTCFGCPCCETHTQICCMKCDTKGTCEYRCPFVNEKGEYIKGKNYKKE